jgi:hypothetical protein
VGLLWRLLAPKPVKKARRTVRKAAHPVHTATRAMTPKPVKQLQHASHPLDLMELKAEDAIVKAVRGKPKQARRANPRASGPAPATREPVETMPGTGSCKERPAWMVDGMRATLVEGAEDLEVTGESYYQDDLWSLAGSHPGPDRVRAEIMAVLVAEDDNPHDPLAVGVWIGGLKVGHLSRYDARRFRPGLLAAQARFGQPIALAGVIAGGGMRADGPGRLGVYLKYDPEYFGL